MIHVISFGYGHDTPPTADFTIDVRKSLRNPFHDDSLRDRNAFDRAVYEHVRKTDGARELVRGLASLVMSFEFSTGRDVTIAFGCVGGRHRSAALAMMLEDELSLNGCDTTLSHRDIFKPLLPAGTHNVKETSA